LVNHLRRARVVCATALLIFSAIATSSYAQGYGLYEQGACAMGRGGAGVAQPCNDGSSMFFNPAGLALDITDKVGSAGFTAIAPRGQFTNSTTNIVSPLSENTYYAPTAYFAMPLSSRAVVGVGLFAPYGLTTEWPVTSEGRYLGYKSAIHSAYVQPTFAFRVNDRVMIGIGVDITHTSLELRKRVDLSTTAIPGAGGLTWGAIGVPKATDFADIDLNGTGMHAGVHIGVIFKAHERLSIGARYLTRQQVSIDNGQVSTTQIATNQKLLVPLPGLPAGTPIDAILGPAFGPGGTLSPQTATTSLPMPDQFVFGLAFKATDKVSIFADYQYTHWALLDQVTIVNSIAPPTILVEQFGDTHGLRAGVEYKMTRATVRAGYDDHGPAAPPQTVTPLLPDADRHEFAFGATVPVDKHLGVDFAYMYINQADRSGRTVDGGSSPTTALNNGVYQYHANLFGLSAVIKF
jgi:long-chain fatty acid transport protein